MRWYMRVHSACFLQFVPILMITMAANYFEGQLSGNPRSAPTAVGWMVLSFYIVATILETVCATWAIFGYQGDFSSQDQEKYYVMNRTFMMVVDYSWFLSLPFAASFQPPAPNLTYHFKLESSWRQFQEGENAKEGYDWGDEKEKKAFEVLKRVIVSLLIVWAHIIPFFCVVLWCAEDHTTSWQRLVAIGLGAPAIIILILWLPVKRRNEGDPNPFMSTMCWFQLNGACFSFCNYQAKLFAFFKAANNNDFRPIYAKWFEGLATKDEPNVGVKFGGNTRMPYSWKAVKERLETIGDRIDAGEFKRESELALTVMNNLMFPEAGKFCLGYNNEDHAFVRPFMARTFDGAQNKTWNLETLRQYFRHEFKQITTLDNNLVTRNMFDITNPQRSKTIITQLVLKVLHKVAFGDNVILSAEDALELAALQTTQLLPAVCPVSLARTFGFWSIIGGPARCTCKKWIRRYK
jgi:hypothetical protein